MLYRQRALQFGAEPQVVTTLQAGARASRLERAPHVQRLSWGLWVVRDELLSPVERAILLQKHLQRPGAPLAVSGLHALELLQLPVGGSETWIEQLLGSRAPYTSSTVQVERAPVQLVWWKQRVQTRQAGIRVGASRGLPLLPGPWGSAMTHPVESLAGWSRHMPLWRITACLDAVISTCFTLPGTGEQQIFTAEDVGERLDELPPHSYGAVRLRRAWEQVRSPCWSPTETLTRLIAVRSGLPEPVLNHEVRIGGQRFLLDLAWPSARVAVEYNGGVHAREIQQYRDEMHRLALLRDAGWHIEVLTWDDLRIPSRRAAWVERVEERMKGVPRKS